MFKANEWEFRESVYFPSMNSTFVLKASDCAAIVEDTDSVTFVHASGRATRVFKSQIREVRGVWNVPQSELVKPKPRGKTAG